MGLDMYFEGTFSTRAFTERIIYKTKVSLDHSFELVFRYYKTKKKGFK